MSGGELGAFWCSIPDGSQRGAGKCGVFSFKLEGDDGVRTNLARPRPQLVERVLVEIMLESPREQSCEKHRLTAAARPETAGSWRGRIYLREVKGAVRGERGHFAGVFGDVAVKARRWIEKVLHVFIDALHLPLEPDKTLIVTISVCVSG